MIGYGGEQSRRLTFWFRDGGTGDWDTHGMNGDSPDEDGGDSGFEQHDDTKCREEEQITMAPGLRFGR